MSHRTIRFMLVILVAASLCPQIGHAWGKKKKDKDVAAEPSAPAAPAVDPVVQQKVLDLITLIETPPTGLIVDNNGQVKAPPDHSPYNPDGSRNQDFTVSHNNPGGTAIMVNYEQKRAEAVQELIKIGKPALDEVCKALVRERYRQRHLYALALGEIKDPRAVPALLKYMEDGQMKLKNVAFVRESGDAKMATKLEQDGNQMIGDSATALQKITGQAYAGDLAQWRKWWEANKAKVGPTPDLIEYTANPPGTSTDNLIHYDPSLAQP